jgi:predicted protein tyrosine phosphatase
MAGEIESLPDNAVMISINEEHEPLYPLKLDRASDKILTLKFTDITARLEHKGQWHHPILIEDTYRVLEFIKKYEGKDFIIHCAAGISRSSAICLYLHIAHGYALKEAFWAVSHPNKYVLGSLFFAKYENRAGHLVVP